MGDGITAPRRKLTTTGGEYSPDVPCGTALRTGWTYEFRNKAGTDGEWKRTRFNHMKDGPEPATRAEALDMLREEVKRWVPDTELRLVETVETIVSDPVQHPDRAG